MIITSNVLPLNLEFTMAVSQSLLSLSSTCNNSGILLLLVTSLILVMSVTHTHTHTLIVIQRKYSL